MPKNKKPRPRVQILVDCPCGMKHVVRLGLGELQVLSRGIIKGKDPNINVQIETYAPTGKIRGDGKPEYAPFKREDKRD